MTSTPKQKQYKTRKQTRCDETMCVCVCMNVRMYGVDGLDKLNKTDKC